ncbi:ATP-binding protein [Paenibacillus sp. USHLN196]|uniref:ATP-binding protein n=1 Tax=Paenibacillus sp. USHLN196 TaxID=3081291 RepID=UPI00301624EB
MLSVRQSDAKKEIERALNEDRINIICLSGPSGSGKTFIIKSYLEEISKDYENWKKYYIEGKKGVQEAYSTIMYSEDVNYSGIEHTTTSFNFGISIPSIFSLGLTNAFKRKEIFNSRVDFFVRQLRKATEQNIVIVADSFEYWDKSSKAFIEAIINRRNLFNYKNIKIIILTTEDDRFKITDIDTRTMMQNGEYFSLSLPDINDISEIINLLGYRLQLSRSELDTIMSLSGGNLDFVKMVIEGLYSDQNSLNGIEKTGMDLIKILENRLRLFGEREKDFYEVLRASSIIRGDFSTDEINYLCHGRNDVDELLSQSCAHLLLKKSNQFTFSNRFIQNFFYERTPNAQTKFHLQYYEYLRENRSESYLTRAIHLSSADHDNLFSSEIIGLYTLAYCRNIAISSRADDQFNIQEIIQNILDKDKELFFLSKDINYLFKACEYYMCEKYSEAYRELTQISDSGSLLFRAEIMRMQLLVSLMMDMNTNKIKKHADALSNILTDLKEEEHEQWAQCSFALFSTYTNKLGNFDMGEHTAQDLLKFLKKHYHIPFFKYLSKVMDRKSFLFKSAVMSRRAIEDSVEYFERTQDYIQYYFALCNYGGILIVLNRFKEANQHLTKCLLLAEEHDYIQFPSVEKVYNNLFLSKFLIHFREEQKLNKEIIEQSITDFKNKISLIPSEKDAIMLINLANLHLINKDFDRCTNILKTLKSHILINNEDTFYDYYMTNLEFVSNVLQCNWSSAEFLLAKMKNNLPEFHKQNIQKLKNRLNTLAKLISDQITLDPLLLDQWVYDNTHHEDEACTFYCRLFLFSDLQFSSL